MDFFGLLSMIGGLRCSCTEWIPWARDLRSLSGGRLERILEKLTSNPIKAYFWAPALRL